jgi:hypothetical protein
MQLVNINNMRGNSSFIYLEDVHCILLKRKRYMFYWEFYNNISDTNFIVSRNLKSSIEAKEWLKNIYKNNIDLYNEFTNVHDLKGKSALIHLDCVKCIDLIRENSRFYWGFFNSIESEHCVNSMNFKCITTANKWLKEILKNEKNKSI